MLWFDEHYGSHPDYGWPDVLEACDAMRLVIAIGTSFSVGVTDLMAGEAGRRGIPLFVVDPQGASIAGRGVVGLREKAEELLPRVCALVGARDGMTAGDPLLRFYRLEGPDARGRTLPEIWAWDAARLEGVHDYIQWLFPLPEPSAFNPHAPILTHGDDRGLPRRPGAATAAAALADADAGFLRAGAGVRRERRAAHRAGARLRREEPPAGCGPATTTTCASRASSRACGCSASTITAGRCIAVSPRSRAITRTRCRRRRWTTGGG